MKTRELMLIALFASLTAVGAFFVIPFGAVPISLQSLVSLLAGLLLGSRQGAWSQLLYLFLGAFGLPVFAGGAAGVGYLLGPTGGYLMGFVFCAFVTGMIAGGKSRRGAPVIVAALVAGSAALYACGITGLMLCSHIGLKSALIVGALPFIPGDLIKMSAAFIIVRKLDAIGIRNSCT